VLNSARCECCQAVHGYCAHANTCIHTHSRTHVRAHNTCVHIDWSSSADQPVLPCASVNRLTGSSKWTHPLPFSASSVCHVFSSAAFLYHLNRAHIGGAVSGAMTMWAFGPRYVREWGRVIDKPIIPLPKALQWSVSLMKIGANCSFFHPGGQGSPCYGNIAVAGK